MPASYLMTKKQPGLDARATSVAFRSTRATGHDVQRSGRADALDARAVLAPPPAASHSDSRRAPARASPRTVRHFRFALKRTEFLVRAPGPAVVVRRDDLDGAGRRGPLEQRVREARAVVAHDDARALEEAHGLGERLVLAPKDADGPERRERGDERPLGALREPPAGREAPRAARARPAVRLVAARDEHDVRGHGARGGQPCVPLERRERRGGGRAAPPARAGRKRRTRPFVEAGA